MMMTNDSPIAPNQIILIDDSPEETKPRNQARQVCGRHTQAKNGIALTLSASPALHVDGAAVLSAFRPLEQALAPEDQPSLRHRQTTWPSISASTTSMIALGVLHVRASVPSNPSRRLTTSSDTPARHAQSVTRQNGGLVQGFPSS